MPGELQTFSGGRDGIPILNSACTKAVSNSLSLFPLLKDSTTQKGLCEGESVINESTSHWFQPWGNFFLKSGIVSIRKHSFCWIHLLNARQNEVSPFYRLVGQHAYSPVLFGFDGGLSRMLLVLLMPTSTLIKLIPGCFFPLFPPLSTGPADFCFSMCYIVQSRFISAKFSLPLIGLSL